MTVFPSPSRRHPYLRRIILAAALVLLTLSITLHPWHSPIPQSILSALTTTTNPTSTGSPQWLLAIFVPPSAHARRAIIRSTWATRFPSPHYTYRFVLGNFDSHPDASLISAENATHGDILALTDFMNETNDSANNIKNLELFTHLMQHGPRYDFVSKVDADIWFSIPPYFETFIQPRLAGGADYDPTALTMIGRPMVWTQKDFAYASGRLYTLSWPLLEFYEGKYTAEGPREGKTEDEVLGQYMFEEGERDYNFVVVELEQAWDIGLEWLVGEGLNTMIIHCVKDDGRLLELSTIFDDRGVWNGGLISGVTSFDREMKEVIERTGKVSEEEKEALRKARDLASSGVDPWETEDWRLILAKIGLEDREAMARMYPLKLPGNNRSTGVVPRNLYRMKHDGDG